MYYIILNNVYFSHFLIWTFFAYQNRNWKIALALIESKKKLQLFVFFIVSLAAPWRADSKNVYMSIANIILSGSKNQKKIDIAIMIFLKTTKVISGTFRYFRY